VTTSDTTIHPAGPPTHWRRNLFAVTATSFMGYTGFTVSMPFLPTFIQQLGVADVGQVALWTGFSLGITPGLTALLSPVWGRLADRFGRKIMVERSLVSFMVLMGAMAFVTRAWHVLALRAAQGLFAGYGSISIAMAESAPRERMPQAIGLVQTARSGRVGPDWRLLAHSLAFVPRFVTAAFYGVNCCSCFFADEGSTHAAPSELDERGRVTFRSVLAFENFLPLMVYSFSSSIAAWPDSAALPRTHGGRVHARAARRGHPFFDHGVHRRARPSFLRPAADARPGADGRRRRRRRGGARVRAARRDRPACGPDRGGGDLRCRHRRRDDRGVQRGRARDPVRRARHELRRADERIADGHGRQPVVAGFLGNTGTFIVDVARWRCSRRRTRAMVTGDVD
jgi:hypothetical protein